jgi:cytochrome c oxidase subunit III
MKYQSVIDVSMLPESEFRSKSVLWWGIVSMVTIESAMFGALAAAYFYIRLSFAEWPPSGIAIPDLGIPTLMVVLLLVSCIPMYIADQLAISGRDNRAMLFWVWVGIVFGFVLLVVRWYEFHALRCRWDSNAYGSIVWFIIGMHTVHLLSSTLETLVLAAHIRDKRIDRKHRTDVHVDTVYWYFVVASWAAFYVIIYWSPRWL